ncbi:MAG: T9SS type A sorting domain-containing protein [Bacteroidetes bacterium]|nr:T9SS type A sorting domain-containing protein [Bacteroidota bacterium]
MKRLILSFIALTMCSLSFGQLSGQKFIPGITGDPNSYATLALAISDLNSVGVGPGGVTFNVATGYTEFTVIPLLITATGTLADPILFRKDPALVGVHPVVHRTDAGTIATSTLGGQGDAVIIIQGSDYITFDAIDVLADNAGVEYGYYLRKASVTDGCKFVTIKNAAITMTKGTSSFVAGIYSSNNDVSSLPSSATGITVTTVGGRNESVTLTGNTIGNVFAGILLRGYNHTTTPYDLQDQNNVVGTSGAGNTIQNFAGNFAAASYGVYLIYQTNPSVCYNVINNVAGGGTNATLTVYGIFMSSTNAGGNFVANNNEISLGQGSASGAHCIYNAQPCNSITINNNMFSYGTFASTTTSYLINCSNATPNIMVSGNSTVGTITKTGIGQLEGYYNFGSPLSGTATISNNTFSNIVLTGASAFYGIRQYSSVNQVEIISNNTISNITGGTSTLYGIYQGYGAAGSLVNSNMITNWTGSGAMVGIYVGASIAPVSLNVVNNTINGLSTTGTSIYGIQNLLGTATNIQKNRVCNLQANNASGIVYGIYLSGGTTTNVYNNFISSLGTPIANAAIPLAGIYVSGGTNANVFFNSVNLYASSTGALFGSAAVYASTAVNLDMRNNILINKSTPKGATGYTVAYRRTTTTLATYSNSSNANNFYAGPPGPANLIFYDGTNADQTLAAYKLRVGPVRDNSSFSEDTPFVAPLCDLHLNPAIPTFCESGGVQILNPISITDDIDGNVRTIVPDVGADEFDGIFAGVVNPGNVTATPISSQQINLGFIPNPSNNNVLIVWNLTGIFTPPAGLPPAPGNSFAGGTVLSYGITSPVIHTGLTWGTTYYYKLFSYNGSSYSAGLSTFAVPSVLQPASLTAVASGPNQIDLSWARNIFLNNVIIATNTVNTFGDPVNGNAYMAGSPLAGGGTIIYVGPLTSFSHTGLNPVTTYYYKAWSVDGFTYYSGAGVIANATTPCLPVSTYPWTEGFEPPTVIPAMPICWFKENGDWVTTNNANATYDADARSGIQFLRESYMATNEYVWTPGFLLSPGFSYDFSFWWAGDTFAGWQGDVFCNTTQSSVGAVQLGLPFVELSTVTTKTYAQVTRTFTPPTAGIYFFAIRVNCPTTTPWYLSFDDFQVVERQQVVVTGQVVDSLGIAPPVQQMYICAHRACGPNDTLSTLNGGIEYHVAGGIGTYTIHCNNFTNPPAVGEELFINFSNRSTLEFEAATVVVGPLPTIYYNPVIRFAVHKYLPSRTSYTWVVVPPHTSLKVHYRWTGTCGNTDVYYWNGFSWVKYVQWNHNHYCTWRYIYNSSNNWRYFKIHNDSQSYIWFDLIYDLAVFANTPGNYAEYATVDVGWRNRPYTSCELGNIVAPTHTFVNQEGAVLSGFPSRLGTDGVQNLTIQFESYNNMFWNDMNLMIDLVNVTQPGTLELYIPDATIPHTTASINAGDTVCYFNPGGILAPGTHTMTLSVSGGLSIGLDAFNFTSVVPYPALPSVTTTPVSGITSTSATSGGNVTSVGGAPVTERGVCWSTMVNPTILDNHTSDGSGPGTFTSLVNGLAPATSYHLRAYAKNIAGYVYGEELVFLTHPMPVTITGTITDSLGISPPAAHVYIVAHPACNPNDTISTLTGGITYSGGTYTLNSGSFLNPPAAGEQVFINFTNRLTQEFDPATVVIGPGPVIYYNPVIRYTVHKYLPFRTSYTWVVVPPHFTLKIHYTGASSCGNTDVYYWDGYRWVKYAQWNHNHYCTWRYIYNSSNYWRYFKIHNDSYGSIWFDLIYDFSIFANTPSNYSEYATVDIGWRNRPYTSCEMGNIIAPTHTFISQDGALLDNFPSRLGTDGVQNLTIQFESYDNMFWNDMNLMIDLVNVTQPGTLELYLPGATVPLTTASINAGDTVCYFNPGGILAPGIHSMTLSASGGLSMGIDAFNFTSAVPYPALPSVTTTPVSTITSTSATSGGIVTSVGGAPVTARGVCWSTSVNPTILDNHTLDGAGPGTFTSLVNGLAPATSYHLRAYAKNIAGYVYGEELVFMTHPLPVTITGTISDSLGISPPAAHVYIVAHPACNPNDTISTLTGGISYSGGTYTLNCGSFLNPPVAGEQVFINFTNRLTQEFEPATVVIGPLPTVYYNPVIRLDILKILPYRTSYTWVAVPPHFTLKIHYKWASSCGNTDVYYWNGYRWVKYAQWNHNHYCTWRYIYNSSNYWRYFKIHNDSYGSIWFDLIYDFNIFANTPSNYSEYATVDIGWRNRPYTSCEMGNIIAPTHTFINQEGAFLDNFPSRLGTDGVQNLTIQFESYNNMFWNDMNLMIDLDNVTQPGTLELYLPDATIPYTTASINAGDTVCYFNPGGIFAPGPHSMTLSATGGLSIGLDAFNFTSAVPYPALPTVTTAAVTAITTTTATSGGTVTSAGGTPVTARGVCWSTAASPTILDSHTSDGSGVGPFTSIMTLLLPSTTYHVRAYAQNVSGYAYGQELVFATNSGGMITGVISDTLGIPPQVANMYIVAHSTCNPNDSLSTMNGGITYTVANGVGTYSLNYGNFINPPTAGDRVFISFTNLVTLEHNMGMVEVMPSPVIYYNVVIRLVVHVHLPFKTSYVRVIIPPHKTLQIHYTLVHGCGNTDVFEWSSFRWTKFRQWNWNHYCTWRYIYNSSNKPKVYVIHNDNGNIWFDLMFNCPVVQITTPSNYNEFALFNMGWRDRPYTACEFGNVVAPNYTYFDYEGASLNEFPSRLTASGLDGVQNLTIQFESYNNTFWNDMTLMIDLVNVTQPGTLQLVIPDATVPVSTVIINPGDTVCYFNPGGILAAGTHAMTLSAGAGLSMGIDGFIYTSAVPIPDLPTVITLPVSSITTNSAMSGGNVTADGGAPVTARGVCWSTVPNPTIIDTHTMDGMGLGTFTSTMSPLMPTTTYYVRAYATNFTGTAYGNEFMFTTSTPVPVFRTVQNVTIAPGQSICYDATSTITVAGGGTYFVVEPTGSAIFVAGINIRYLPGTWIKHAAYMHGYIDLTGTYCTPFVPGDAPVATGVEFANASEQSLFRIYPNPTTGNFTLEQLGEKFYQQLKVEVYSMRGEKVMTAEITGERKHEFQSSQIPDGLYVVKVLTNDYVETFKLIKTK